MLLIEKLKLAPFTAEMYGTARETAVWRDVSAGEEEINKQINAGACVDGAVESQPGPHDTSAILTTRNISDQSGARTFPDTTSKYIRLCRQTVE